MRLDGRFSLTQSHMINHNLITRDHVIHHKPDGLVRPVEDHKSPILLPGAISHQHLVTEEFQSHRYVVDGYM